MLVMIDTDIATSWTIVTCNKQEKEIISGQKMASWYICDKWQTYKINRKLASPSNIFICSQSG